MQLEEAAAAGKSFKELAAIVGENLSAFASFYNYEKNHSVSNSLYDYVSRGRTYCIDAIENALYRKALSGNIQAIIFFLKNMKPEVWKERIDTNQNVRVEDIKIVL